MFQDILHEPQPRHHISLILTLHKEYSLGQQGTDIVVIENFCFKTLGKGGIEYVHRHAQVIHHVQSIDRIRQIATLPILVDHLDLV